MLSFCEILCLRLIQQSLNKLKAKKKQPPPKIPKRTNKQTNKAKNKNKDNNDRYTVQKNQIKKKNTYINRF